MTMHLCSPGLEPDLDIISSEQLKHHVYFFAAKTSKLQVDVLPEICGQLSPLFWNSFHYCRQPIHWSSLSFFPSARNGRNFIKGQLKQFKIPQRSTNIENLQHQPQPFLTMLFYKSFISFVTAIALASSVTASATPERRQYWPPTSNCQASTGSSMCCSSTTPFSGLSEGLQSGLVGLPNLNLNTPIGLDCVLPGLLGWYCTPRFLYLI